MRFSLRIFLGFFLLIGLMGAVVFNVLHDEIRPVLQQSAEDVLVDTSQLLAELVRDDLQAGRVVDGAFADAMARLSARDPGARIRGIDKRVVDLRVYVTDAQGRVLYDSAGTAPGSDYSQWRDVYLTLRGSYGARTSRTQPGNPLTTWMYVGAPVLKDGEIIGVVSVGKPTSAIYPYIAGVQERLVRGGLVLFVCSLLLGALFSWWLSRAIGQLTGYARAVRDGNRVPPPTFFANRELSTLAGALEEMRASLDGKNQVEEYVLGLTHELKSPLAGIAASAELLHEALPPADRARFAGHVVEEAMRLREIVERLLALVRIEKQMAPVAAERIDVSGLIDAVCAALATQAEGAGVRFEVRERPAVAVFGERFLLEQALRNLVQNAMDFATAGSAVTLGVRPGGGLVVMAVHNEGDPIPAWAFPRLFERFFSLPRPRGGRKGTGLGLPLVQTIARLHHGTVTVRNEGNGVTVELALPGA